MRRMIGGGPSLLAALVVIAGSVQAQVPQLLHYQGQLTDASGVPLLGPHAVKFRVYDEATGGTELWNEEHSVSLQENGIFSVILGSLTPFGGLDLNRPLWLSIEVDGEGEMSPRQRLTAVIYAINTDRIDGLDASQFLRGDIDAVANGQLTLTHGGPALVIQPASNPPANTKLMEVRNAAGASVVSADLEGDVSIAGHLSVGGTIGGATSTTGTTSASWTIGSTTDATSTTLSLQFGQPSGQESILFQGAGSDEFIISDDLRLSTQGHLRLEDDTGGDYVALRAPSGVTTHTLTLPPTLGSAGQVLSTDASGTLSWISAAGSGGTVTLVTAAGGLTATPNPITATGTIAIAPDGVTSALIADGTVSAADLATDSVGADELRLDAIQPGDIEIADVPSHVSTHQPGGVDAMPTAAAVGVGSANSAGSATSLARADHVHQGLHALGVAGQPPLVGDATLAAGPHVTLSQAGQTITIASVPGNRVTASASAPLTISTSAETTLLSATVTKSQASSVLVIVASVQLNHTGPPTSKTVDVKMFRGATQLDAAYRARIGTANQAVSEVPVSVHFWETGAAGTYSYRFTARSSGAGAQATIRRLSIIEVL